MSATILAQFSPSSRGSRGAKRGTLVPELPGCVEGMAFRWIGEVADMAISVDAMFDRCCSVNRLL